MARTLRELKNCLKQVDLILETCDARIPLCSRNVELDRLAGQKPRILVLNKADLADPTVTDEWITWFQKSGVTALFCDSCRRSGIKALEKTARDMTRSKVDQAMTKGRLFRPIRMLVVGIPNTGKSSLINAILGRKIAQTAGKPGLTHSIGWLRAGKDLELMDTPGVLRPKIGDRRCQVLLAATGAIRDDLLPVEKIGAEVLSLLSGLYPSMIRERYQLSEHSRIPEELMVQAALKRGCLMSGGRPDTLRFARLFIDDLRNGRIGRISLERPPS